MVQLERGKEEGLENFCSAEANLLKNGMRGDCAGENGLRKSWEWQMRYGYGRRGFFGRIQDLGDDGVVVCGVADVNCLLVVYVFKLIVGMVAERFLGDYNLMKVREELVEVRKCR